jgi:hypothetical protein
VRVFFDGRSDFYGPAIGADYQELLSAGPRWREAFDRYRFEAALLPPDWPLGRILEREPGWRIVDRDQDAVLLLRGDVQETRAAADTGALGVIEMMPAALVGGHKPQGRQLTETESERETADAAR